MIATVMRGAIIPTVLGMGIGIPIALVCVRLVKAQLYEITNADASVIAGAIVLQSERPVSDREKLARRTLAGINPNLAVVKFQTFDEQVANRFTEDRLIARL